jgi:hypothetical protein
LGSARPPYPAWLKGEPEQNRQQAGSIQMLENRQQGGIPMGREICMTKEDVLKIVKEKDRMGYVSNPCQQV